MLFGSASVEYEWTWKKIAFECAQHVEILFGSLFAKTVIMLIIGIKAEYSTVKSTLNSIPNGFGINDVDL